MLTSGASGMRRWGRHLLTATAAYKWETFLTYEGSDPNLAMSASSLETLAIKSNKDFQDAYGKAGGSNASFHFPPAGNHAWQYWAAQLQALKPDLIATING